MLQGRINAQGKLLLQDTFVIRESFNVDKQRKVFLFEQSIIFSEVVDKRNDEMGFVFRNRFFYQKFIDFFWKFLKIFLHLNISCNNFKKISTFL